jgi:hypothetical protein
MRSFLLALLTMPVLAQAQDIPLNNSGKKAGRPMVALYADFSFHSPGGDMANRFGNFNGFGFGFWSKTSSLWTLGGSFRPMFGGKVFEPNLLGDMNGVSGSPIDQNGQLHSVRVYMRGYHSQIQLGRVIPFTANAHSGLHIQAGVGFLQHKIKFTFDERFLPQLNKPYQYGYDRLSNGLTISQSITLQHVDIRNGISVFGGIELVQGFTYNRRSMDYPTRTRETAMRNDNFSVIKAGLLIPVFRKKKDDEEFFN